MREYPSKVILLWAQAILNGGVARDWLMENDYQELGLFCFALRHDRRSRDWLMENGHPHLMALISGSEGDRNALLWLRKHGAEMLAKTAMAADNDEDAMWWLMSQNLTDMLSLARAMRIVKNSIESDNNDVHKITLY
jgi:hypothetical protein